MNIEPKHSDALQSLGYTESEARFLYIVATHSGYFVARQFLAFHGAHWGKRAAMFWSKFERQKHARIASRAAFRRCHTPISGVVQS
jgi:hypothetical protein